MLQLLDLGLLLLQCLHLLNWGVLSDSQCHSSACLLIWFEEPVLELALHHLHKILISDPLLVIEVE